MTDTKIVRSSGIGREFRESYGRAWFGGRSARLFGEVVREFPRLKTFRELCNALATLNLLHADSRVTERAEAKHGPPRLLVTHDESGEFDR